MASRLALLIAVLLMPFAMAPAASTAPHHGMAAAMPAQHCPDQESRHDMRGGIAECTMVCAASLPAVHEPIGERLAITRELLLPAATERLHGLNPETATPPPKPF